MGDVDVDALLEAPYEPNGAAKPERDSSEREAGGKSRRSREEYSDDEGHSRKRRRHRSPDSRSPHRDRDRDRDRRYRHRDSDREGDRDGRRERDYDRDRRDRDHDRRRDTRRGRDYDRDRRDGDRRDRERRDKDYYDRRERDDYDRRGGRYERRRDSHRRRDKPREPSPPRLTASQLQEKNERTVFGINLPMRGKKQDLIEFFEQAGKVSDVRMILDRAGRSKGMAYIEYEDKLCIPQALQLNGQPCLGYPVRVQQTQAEKNDLASAAPVGPTRVSVENIHPSLEKEDLRDLFEEFGHITSITLDRAERAGENGSAMVNYKNPDNAKLAVSRLDGFDVGGVVLQVMLRGSSAPPTQAVSAPTHGLRAGELDDEADILPMNAAKRALLMQSLGQRVGVTAAEDPVATMVKPLEPRPAPRPDLGAPSTCVLLKNMFDPAKEEGDRWHIEIEEETKEEAEKFGRVRSCHVDRQSQGCVYIRFEAITAASEAIAKFNGRYFGGQRIEASYMPEELYELQFGPSTTK